jgi:hypothetical protein
VATKNILLSLETALRMQIAFLKRENADLMARLVQQQTDYTYTGEVQSILAAANIRLPVPLTQCRFDPEQHVLTYEAPEETDALEA